MINLFRKIRERLLTDNRPSSPAGRYLLYAIGEIILVVCGILIAITLNNSNHSKQLIENSDSKLVKLRQLLYKDSISMSLGINNSKSIIAEIDTALTLLHKDLSYSDYKIVITKIFLIPGPRQYIPDRSIYDEMLSSGDYSIITNLELKGKITEFYTTFDHFYWIMNSYGESSEYSDLRSAIYREDIIRFKYVDEIAKNQESSEGYLHFKKAISDESKYGKFENFVYARKIFHEKIVLYNEILLNRMLHKLPIEPKITKANNRSEK